MIYAQMIGRNESSRFLEDVLQKLSSQVDKIIFTDDCSTDNTPEIAAKYAEVFQSPEPLFKVHEAKLRAYAWGNMEKFAKKGDWIVAIDCDEKLFHLENIDIRTALSSLASKVKAMKEESDTPSDTEGVYKIIETLKLLKNHLNNINSKEEFEQLIFALLKYIDPKGTITKDTSKLANAIISASSRSSLKDARPIDLNKLGR